MKIRIFAMMKVLNMAKIENWYHSGKLAQMAFTPHPPSPYLGNVQKDGPRFINEASLVIAAEYFILVLLCDLVSVVDWVGRGGGNPA